MTVVHFLHPTDIGLALRKHKAIYRISLPLYFLPPILSLSCICISAMQTGVWCQMRQLYRPYLSLFFLKPQSISKCLSFPSLDMTPLSSISLLLSTSLSPSPSPPSLLHPLPPLSLSLCLCFPLHNCFAVDLTAMINDLKASGKQTERDATSSPFPYKPPFFSYVNCSYVHTEHIMTSG